VIARGAPGRAAARVGLGGGCDSACTSRTSDPTRCRLTTFHAGLRRPAAQGRGCPAALPEVSKQGPEQDGAAGLSGLVS